MTNPAILNMLQSYTPDEETQGNPASPQMGQSNMGGANPYDSGIQGAIASARQSLGMTRDQDHRAIRSGMAAYGKNLSQAPRQRGFFNNLITGVAGLGDGVSAYDNSEDYSLRENQAMADKIIKYQQHQAEEQARQNYQNAQLAEQKRFHNLTHDYHKALLKNKGEEGNIKEIEGRAFKKLDKIEQRQVDNLATALEQNLHKFSNARDSFDKLNTLTKDNIFQPIGGWSKASNFIKDTWGRYTGNEELRDETAQRELFASQLMPLTVSLERAAKGGGQLGKGMYEALKPSFPDPKTDDYPTLVAKMNNLNSELERLYKTAKFSADQGVFIDGRDLDELFPPKEAPTSAPSYATQSGVGNQSNMNMEMEAPNPTNIFSRFHELQAPQEEEEEEYIWMENPATGERAQVHRDSVPQALEQKLRRVQ